MRTVLALGAFFVVALVVAACGSGSSVPGNSVADVVGNPITLQTFNHWMYVAAKSSAAQSPGQPVIVPNDPPNFDKCIADVKKQIPSLAKESTATLRSDCKTEFQSLSSQVMDFLITSYWYQADAARMHINVTDAQVLKTFDAQKKAQFPTNSAYQKFLSQTGQTQQDILYRFRVSEIFQKLASKYPTKVTPAAIESYYNSHKSQFGHPETRNMRIVLAKTQAQANAAKTALTQGQSWNVVAKKYSTDPTTKSKGGLLTNVTKGEEDAALNNAAFSAPSGKLLGPVKGQFGYYVFEVTSISKASQQSLAQATPAIKATLTAQLQSNAQTAVTNAAKKRYLSQTTCRAEYAMADCSGYKAPKSSTPTNTSTTG